MLTRRRLVAFDSGVDTSLENVNLIQKLLPELIVLIIRWPRWRGAVELPWLLGTYRTDKAAREPYEENTNPFHDRNQSRMNGHCPYRLDVDPGRGSQMFAVFSPHWRVRTVWLRPLRRSHRPLEAPALKSTNAVFTGPGLIGLQSKS